MILNFGAKNFFCFREGVDISFELSQNCPKNISQGNTVANVLCVKGANASGKTNVLKILPTIFQFCKNSFSLKPDDEIKIETFFNNIQPSEFYLEFIIRAIKYRYELSVTRKKVISEKLYRIKKRESLIIERKNNQFIKCIDEYKELQIMKLRPNVSFISSAHQYGIASINNLYNFFSLNVSNVNYLGLSESKLDLNFVTDFFHSNKDAFEFSKNIIRNCDMGIDDIEIRKHTDTEGKLFYYPVFFHSVKQHKYNLSFYNQSSGTRSLYLDLILYWGAIISGSVLVLDEFDTNFHPHILPKLVELFTNRELNSNQAQFIFTTHNADIMDVMGKYRIVSINKEDNESYGYRLDEIPGDIIRNDRSILPAYNAGKIGGVPRI